MKINVNMQHFHFKYFWLKYKTGCTSDGQNMFFNDETKYDN